MILILPILVAVYFASVFVIGHIVFSPLKSDASKPPTPGVRFQLTDMLAIFFPFQLGFAAINLFLPDIQWNVAIAIATTIVLLLITGLTWIYGMRLLWRMKVHQAKKRVALLGIVMPIGCVLSATALPILASVHSLYDFLFRAAAVLFMSWILRRLVVWIRSNQFAQDPTAPDAV
ncbi:MAG: hypothetical protein GY880_27785 [Planctomycetaceae bacterium]|nr:hypothetical protein [Planctomycetaceae bacterium]MCP4778040.1 hypothetical protein [Planctomycetaceae bacterium]